MIVNLDTNKATTYFKEGQTPKFRAEYNDDCICLLPCTETIEVDLSDLPMDALLVLIQESIVKDQTIEDTIVDTIVKIVKENDPN